MHRESRYNRLMKLYILNSAFLGNINPFLH